MKRRGAIWLVVIASCCGGTVGADEPDPKKAEREARLQSMQQIAERFKVLKPDETEPVTMIAAPLLLSRRHAVGVGKNGASALFAHDEQYGGHSWFECISLAGGKFTAEVETLK